MKDTKDTKLLQIVTNYCRKEELDSFIAFLNFEEH